MPGALRSAAYPIRTASRRNRYAAAGLLAAWLVVGLACAASQGYPTRLPTQRLIIEGPDGERNELTARVAADTASRRRGMQDLAAETIRTNPMWFVYPRPRRTSFHMRNVAIPLTIAYVGSDGTILAVERMEPGGTGYGVDQEIHYALEVATDRAQGLALQAGARIRYPDGPPSP